jgi:uncharacterized membrane protein YidH (DUF202 family)
VTDGTWRADGPAGLQAERTRLAWSRTALSLAVNGLLLLHGGGFAGRAPAVRFLPGIAVLLCAAAFHLCGVRRYRHTRRALETGRPVTAPRALRLMGLVAVVPGVLALLGALTGR